MTRLPKAAAQQLVYTMVIQAFPPVEQADEYGLLAFGGDLEVESLLLAYRNGIFPWPLDARLLTWFAPSQRTILWLRDFHISRSLKKVINQSKFYFSIDRCFTEVIRACAATRRRKGQRGTWITSEMVKAYIALHQAGYAHSIEAWDENTLVGGLYGVSIGKMFAGESMFYVRNNASKLALCFLVDYLRERSVEWIDCQVMTPLFKHLGAIQIARDDFQVLLINAVDLPVRLF